MHSEKLRITSGGNVNIGDFSQTDSKVTIVDVSRPIAEATLNLQSSTTSGAADTGPVLRFYGHSGSEGRYHASIKGAKESGNVGSTAAYLAFNTRPSGGGAMAEAARFNSSGNLVFPSGQGIDFSATANSTNSGSMSSELLDDYEEGSWVPSFSGRTLGTAEGTYTKIGRQILIQFNIATLNSSISAGNISVNGLPFQARNINQNGAVFIADTSGVTYSSGYGRIYGRINGAGNSMQLLQRTNDGSTHTTSPALGTNLTLRGYAWYTTS